VEGKAKMPAGRRQAPPAVHFSLAIMFDLADDGAQA